jgi:hypothetical protein
MTCSIYVLPSQLQHDRKFTRTCDVILRRVRVTIVAMGGQYVLHILSGVCSLSYAGCNAHASYCYLWPVWLYHIIPHYIINSRFSGKNY